MISVVFWSGDGGWYMVDGSYEDAWCVCLTACRDCVNQRGVFLELLTVRVAVRSVYAIVICFYRLVGSQLGFVKGW